MEYDDIRTYIFRPDLSNNLTGDEIVTIVNPGKSAVDEGKRMKSSFCFQIFMDLNENLFIGCMQQFDVVIIIIMILLNYLHLSFFLFRFV